MLFFIRFDIHQPASMSNRELIEIWDREADAPCPMPSTVDRALAGLPIVQEMGGSVKTEVLPIYDYRTYAGDLKEAVQG